MSDEKKTKMEIAEQVAATLDKGAKRADELLSSTKAKTGDIGSKITVAAVIILVLAMIRDSGLLWIALIVLALLFLKPILDVVKKQMAKSEYKKQVTKQEDKK